MAHDREFQRRRKDTRMPVRDSHGEDQPAARQTEQNFDLRRARDTPSSVNGKTHRQDIPVQTEFSHLSPETPASLLEQGEAYATALDGFSEHFETPDATRTAPPIQDNVRSNFRQEASRRSFVTEDVTDHDTGKYAPSSEGSAHRTAQTDPVRNTVTEHTSMGTNISSVFRKRHRRRNRQRRRKRVWIANRRKHPNWNLLRMNCRRSQRIKSSPMQDGGRNGLHKKQSRHKTVCQPGRNCAWRRFPTRRPEKPKNT